MEHRQLGKSGLRVSTLGLGAMTFGAAEGGAMKALTSSDEDAQHLIDRALDVGIDFIDTADSYSEGRSEELLGRSLGERRRNVILATKCRLPVRVDARPMEYGLSRRHVIRSCEESLRRLRTDWIDLYQVHMQDPLTPIEETLRALDDLIRDGKIRYIGCSNYSGYRLVESLWAADRRNLSAFQSLQLQWSLIDRGAERELVPACRYFGLGIVVWSPLARGLLSGKYAKDQPTPEGSRFDVWRNSWKKMYEKKFNNDRTWEIVDAVRVISHELDTTPARVALAWLLRKPEVSCIIIGARTLKQLDDNVAALSVQLLQHHVEMLDKISGSSWGYPYDGLIEMNSL
jgi:aryl-alcohol dehydrogenase-like predicted oxidoreductase